MNCIRYCETYYYYYVIIYKGQDLFYESLNYEITAGDADCHLMYEATENRLFCKLPETKPKQINDTEGDMKVRVGKSERMLYPFTTGNCYDNIRVFLTSSFLKIFLKF